VQNADDEAVVQVTSFEIFGSSYPIVLEILFRESILICLLSTMIRDWMGHLEITREGIDRGRFLRRDMDLLGDLSI
jgi:hypothetical protein